jgi:hypothetical protein
MDETEVQKLARKRVQMKRGFVVHLLLYVFVNAMLFIIWNVTGKGYPWFIWPLAGWGIGIFANAIALVMELFSPEEQAVEREMRRIHHEG